MSSPDFTYVLLAVMAGVLLPLQIGANTLLARSMGGPIGAAVVSFSFGLILLLAMNFAVFRQFPTAEGAARTPPYLYAIGGTLGAVILSTYVLTAPRLGAAALLCFVIAGQLVSALVVDRFGLFGVMPQELSVGRILGVVAVFAGALMVRLL